MALVKVWNAGRERMNERMDETTQVLTAAGCPTGSSAVGSGWPKALARCSAKFPIHCVS